MSNEPPRNPFAAPDPNRPSPPPAPTPEGHTPQGADAEGHPEPSSAAPKPPSGGQKQQGGGQKPTKDEGKPPSTEELKEASGATFRFGALLILALLGSQLPLPYTLAAPVLIIAAIVYGIFALRRSWAISSRNLMTPMLVAGIVMALMMSVTVAAKFTLWPVEMERQECVQYAITHSAKAECQANYDEAVSDRLDSLRGSLPASD